MEHKVKIFHGEIVAEPFLRDSLYGATSLQAITASVNGWGALRIRKGFQMKATPGEVEFRAPKSLWALTAPTPFRSASIKLDPS